MERVSVFSRSPGGGFGNGGCTRLPGIGSPPCAISSATRFWKPVRSKPLRRRAKTKPQYRRAKTNPPRRRIKTKPLHRRTKTKPLHRRTKNSAPLRTLYRSGRRVAVSLRRRADARLRRRHDFQRAVAQSGARVFALFQVAPLARPVVARRRRRGDDDRYRRRAECRRRDPAADGESRNQKPPTRGRDIAAFVGVDFSGARWRRRCCVRGFITARFFGRAARGRCGSASFAAWRPKAR